MKLGVIATGNSISQVERPASYLSSNVNDSHYNMVLLP